MGIFRRPDSPYWWLWLETTRQKERTDVRIGTTTTQRKDSRKMAEDRYHQRMNELAALCWLTETSAVAASSRGVFVVDFDAFLLSREETLTRLCGHLGATTEPASVRRALSGGVMDRYAKATEHAYNAETRAEGLSEARTRFGAEIRAGMAWLDKTAKAFPEGERALARFS